MEPSHPLGQHQHVVLCTRRASPADLSELCSLVNAAFAVETFLEGDRTNEPELARMARAGEFWVLADLAGNILASAYTQVRESGGYLGMLAVDPAHQGQGLGRRMIGEAEARLRTQGCTRVMITVASLRLELRGFYSRLGYTEVDRAPLPPSRELLPGYECDLIRMEKSL